MSQENKIYTVVAMYDENEQRYSPDCAGPTPTDAVISAILSGRADNKERDLTITVFGVFEGEHDAQDTTVSQADERPESEPYSDQAPMLPFTVVTENGEVHVATVNAIEAELSVTEGDDEMLVGGVLAGHLDNCLDEVDWARVEAETAVCQEV